MLQVELVRISWVLPYIFISRRIFHAFVLIDCLTAQVRGTHLFFNYLFHRKKAYEMIFSKSTQNWMVARQKSSRLGSDTSYILQYTSWIIILQYYDSLYYDSPESTICHNDPVLNREQKQTRSLDGTDGTYNTPFGLWSLVSFQLSQTSTFTILLLRIKGGIKCWKFHYFLCNK